MIEDDIDPMVVASVPFLGGVLGCVLIAYLMTTLAAAPTGEGMQVFIAEQIQGGSTSFLKTEYTYLLPFVAVVGAFILAVLETQDDAPKGFKEKGGWQTLICFLCGATLSAGAGWSGMKVATDANVKTMEAAKKALNPALRVAFSGGAIMGFTVVSSGIIGITVLFYAFAVGAAKDGASAVFTDWQRTSQEAIRFLTGFAFGASSIALFARVAGGIYTKVRQSSLPCPRAWRSPNTRRTCAWS